MSGFCLAHRDGMAMPTVKRSMQTRFLGQYLELHLTFQVNLQMKLE